MKIWITKYALTQGVYSLEAEIDSDYPDMAVHRTRFPSYFHKPYWHLTEEEAVAHAETMRVKKIVSLRKSIAKLENLRFEKTA